MNLEAFKAVVPSHLQSAISGEVLTVLDGVCQDGLHLTEVVRENLLVFSNVLHTPDRSIPLKAYVSAVVYISYKHCGESCEKGFSRAFPQVYADIVSKPDKTKLLNKAIERLLVSKVYIKIMTSSMVSPWLSNQKLFQEALNTLGDLMRNAKSEKVRHDSANSLLTHLAIPADKPVETVMLDIALEAVKELASLKAAMCELSDNQKARIVRGEPTLVIAEEVIVKGEADAT